MAKKKKGKSLLTQAQELGTGKYAPVLKEIELNKGTNTSLYTAAGNQRRTAADREIGSISAAGATAGKMIGDLGTSNASMYQKAIADSQSNNQALLDKVNANNSGMLSSLQASMKARGVTNIADYSNLQGEVAKKNELFAALGSIQTNSMQQQSGLADQRFKALQAGSSMLDTTAKSAARGAAQANMDELYTKWLSRQQELETAGQKTELEKGDYINQTYMTLKEQAAAKKAAAASAALQAGIAAGNLGFKYENLYTNTQLSYDKLAQTKAQKDIENKFKEQGFTAAQAKEASRQAVANSNDILKWDKWNWQKAHPETAKGDKVLSFMDALLAGN